MSVSADLFALHSMCSDAGPTAGFQYHLNAANLAVEDVNAVGGILGRQVRIVDHSAEDVTSVGLADTLHAQGSDYLIGPNGSSLVLRNLGVTTPRRMIQAGYNNAGVLGDARRYPYYFQPHFTGDQQAVLFLAFATQHLGARRIGVLYERSVFGDSALAAHRRLAAGAGAEVVAEAVSLTASSYARPITALRRAGAEVLVLLVTASPTVQLLLAGLARTGWTPPVLGQSTLLDPALHRQLPRTIAESCYGTAFVRFCRAADRPVGERQRGYAARLGATLRDGQHMGLMAHLSSPYYDWLQLLKLAIEEAGTFDTSEVRRVLESTTGHDGMLSRFSFTPESHTGVSLDDITLGSVASLLDGAEVFPEQADGADDAVARLLGRVQDGEVVR